LTGFGIRGVLGQKMWHKGKKQAVFFLKMDVFLLDIR
jgi:hypothetical protein